MSSRGQGVAVKTIITKDLIVIPRNDLLKTPSFVFDSSIPEQALIVFLNGIIAPKNNDNTVFDQIIRQRYEQGNNVDPISFFSSDFSLTRSLGQTLDNDLGQSDVISVEDRLGLEGGVNTSITFPERLTAIGISHNYWSRVDASGNPLRDPSESGFVSIAAAIASTMAHELGHQFIVEAIRGLGGHAELLLVPFATGGDVNSSAIRFDDVLALQIAFSERAGLFQSKQKFIDGKIRTYPPEVLAQLGDLESFLVKNIFINSKTGRRIKREDVEYDFYIDSDGNEVRTISKGW